MKGWFKFWKTFRGGGCVSYFEFDENLTEGEMKGKVSYWAEYEDGGENYGYRFGYEKINKPPEDWISSKIAEMQETIIHVGEQLSGLRQLLVK